MRIFQNKAFAEFVRKNRIPLAALCSAVRELSSGLVHANLGGGVYKQRIARPGQGKSGSYRTIIFFRLHQRLFCILGFAKSSQGNIGPHQVLELKELAKELLNYDDTQIQVALDKGIVAEIFCEDDL